MQWKNPSRIETKRGNIVLDALALTPCYPAFLITSDVPEIWPRVPGRDFDDLPSKEDTISFLRDIGHYGVINSLNDVVGDQMHQPWRTFAALINRNLSGKTTGLDKLYFTYQIDNKVYKKQEKIEASQEYGDVLPECLTSPAMKESKAYKTYLSYATGAVPPKVARKFKKASPTKKDSVPVQADEEPVQKGKRVKRAAKKPSNTPATSIVIREPTMETKSKRKNKEKVDVAHGKGIELLSDVALTEEVQMKEVLKKCLRDFHKTHPNGSCTIAEDPPRVAKITPTVKSKGTGEKSGVPDVNNDDSSKSESESWGNDKDDNNNEQESSDESSKQETESEEQESDSRQDEESDNDDQEVDEFDQENEFEDDEVESDEEQGMDDTIDQFDDDADARLEEPIETATGIVQDTHVTITTVTKKTEVPVTSSSRSSDLATKFLNFLDIPHTDAEIVSPLDIHVHHEVPRPQAPILLSIPVFVIPESSPVFSNIPQSSHTFTPTPILATPTPPPTIQTKNPLSNLLDFASDKDEDPSAGSDRGLKKRKISKDADLTTEPKKKDSTSGTSIGTKSQPRSSRKSVQSEELVFEVANSDMPHDQEGNLGDHEDEPRQENSSRSDLFKKPPPTQEPTDPDWNVGKTNKEGGDYLFDLSKPLPLITRGKRQRVPYEFFINNDLKYLQGGILTMTYTTSTTKTKAAQYDLPGIEDMVPNIWNPVKSKGDVYSTKHILAVTYVSVMRKYGYGYLEEIVVRRADNVLCRFKEGDFPRLRINDIEDMLILVVQNWLSNLLWDDVADFAIALRMYTRSLVIQRRVEDL
ncbi:hypothetical protein Tco_0309326 [Tanacetum coccineum]